MKIRMLKSFLVAAGLFAFLACQKEVAYHLYQPIPSTGWARNDTLTFTLPPTLPAGNYAVEIGIRNKNDYRYRDLWIYVGRYLGDSNHYESEKVHLYVADKTGKWKGSGTSGLYQFTVPYLKEIKIGEGETKRTFSIASCMQDERLTGLSDIGLRILYR
ncbi:gliding motility-associated lipoprotein GldH [Bacteroidetes bacterium oral taxon 272 str. F0290]|nr:gliding motility-associated lipoprotein GldH [Bacteroidetes bacterium oral taxon 272 str. F0290]